LAIYNFPESSWFGGYYFWSFFRIWLWPTAMIFRKIESKTPSAVCEHCKKYPFPVRRNNDIVMFSFLAQMTPKQLQRFQTWLVINP
jgi:hypothetical protein